MCYVTKMKKNLKYEVLESVTYVNDKGLVTHIDQKVRFTRGELTHEARRVEIFYKDKKRHRNQPFLVRGGAYFLKKKARSPIIKGFGQDYYVLLSFTGQQ